MVQITYEPKDHEDRLRGTSVFGLTFEAGKAVEVPDNHIAATKLRGHPEFVGDGAAHGGYHPPVNPADVDIPENWRDLHWQERAALARRISGGTVKNGDAAGEIIEAEVARRIADGEVEAT